VIGNFSKSRNRKDMKGTKDMKNSDAVLGQASLANTARGADR
jgi:hypothetical protein